MFQNFAHLNIYLKINDIHLFLGNGLRTAPDMMKMKNLEREMDMRTMKKEQNELAMNVFGLQDYDACNDHCNQEITTWVDDRVDYDEDYLDSADCDNSEMCAYRTRGAMFACGTNDYNQCVADSIGDDCASCFPNSRGVKLPKFLMMIVLTV